MSYDHVMQEAAKEAGIQLPTPTPEQVAAFDEWLQEPENKARLDRAIYKAQMKLNRDND